MNTWTEHRNPEGRTYWFSTATKESVWEKPDVLKTPFERALVETKWREYFSGGRKYYYNTETKESKWDMPDELLLLLEQVGNEGVSNPQVPANAGAPSSATPAAILPAAGASATATQSNLTNGTDSALTTARDNVLPFTPSSILPARPNLPDDPVIPHNGFATFEEGEKAFMHLLRKAGVDANWTWDQTMRAIITDPLYKALNSLAEKKTTWQKFTDALKAKEQEERETRLSKLRPALRNMLKGNPNVFHYTTFATADKLFAQHPIWQQAKIEAERRLIFEEYVAEMKQREMQETRAARNRSISKVLNLFKTLEIDVTTKWRTTHSLVLESEDWNNDPELRKLPTLDILLAFEDYSRVKEREFEDQSRRSQVEKTRRERKNRESFKQLLKGLVDSGKIKSRSKWKEVYPIFCDDERYLNMLGNPGSNPLELFWDVVDQLDQDLDDKIAVVVVSISRHNSQRISGEGDNATAEPFAVGPNTTEAEYMKVIQEDNSQSVRALSQEDLRLVFVTLRDQAVKKQADEKRRAEKRLRHLQDDLRYALKKLSEPLDISIGYDAAVPLIQNLPEFQAIDGEEARRAAFAKFVKRQKERLREPSEDDGSNSGRKRKEPGRDHRDGDRERERSERPRESERESQRGKDPERESRHSRHYPRGHEEYDSADRRSSRDYTRDRDRGRDHAKDVDREKDPYRSSKHHRDSERDERKRDRRSSYAGTREWDDVGKRGEQARSNPAYQDEVKGRRENATNEKIDEAPVGKKQRLESPNTVADAMEVDQKPSFARAETPEEGEI